MPINSGSSTSAGVYVGEQDNSLRATAISTSIGAIVGPSHKGPVGEPTLVVDEDEFINTFGQSDEALTFMHYCARAFLQDSNRLYVVRVAVEAKLGGLKIATEGNFSVAKPLVSGYDAIEDVVFSQDDIMVILARNPGEWNNDLRVLMYPNTNDPEGEQFVLQIFEGTSQIAKEVFYGTLRDKLDGYGHQLNIVNQCEENSKLVQILVNEEHPRFLFNEATLLINALLTGSFTYGSSGDPVTQSDIIQGWDRFSDKEEVSVSILINAGYTDVSVQLKMADIAEKRDDCFAVLDIPRNEQSVQEAIAYRRETLNLNSSYAALYAPDLWVRDTREQRDLYLPPSGHVAGVYARTDRVADTWFAPAGLNRGQLNVNGIREIYKQGHRDALHENQINPIRLISGKGIVVWGAETLQAHASALSNVNVRRLLNLLKNSIANAILVGVFEPNDRFLRLQLVGVAEGLLNPIKRGRGLYGFSVICDERNNTNETIANGDLILDVYIDPVIPAKRIHLNAIIPKTGQIKFAQELIYPPA
jgi:phage tail sheath protein FI